jgi:hypothetical protein
MSACGGSQQPAMIHMQCGPTTSSTTGVLTDNLLLAALL